MLKNVFLVGSKLLVARASDRETLDRSAPMNSGQEYYGDDGAWFQDEGSVKPVVFHPGKPLPAAAIH
jgi:hypothetical protein